MFKYIVIAAAIALIWVYWAREKKEAVQKQLQEQGAQYGQNMQNSVQRAEAAAEAANKLIKQQEADVRRGIQHAQ